MALLKGGIASAKSACQGEQIRFGVLLYCQNLCVSESQIVAFGYKPAQLLASEDDSTTSLIPMMYRNRDVLKFICEFMETSTDYDIKESIEMYERKEQSKPRAFRPGVRNTVWCVAFLTCKVKKIFWPFCSLAPARPLF